jgi:hypothetical protein
LGFSVESIKYNYSVLSFELVQEFKTTCAPVNYLDRRWKPILLKTLGYMHANAFIRKKNITDTEN